MNQAERDVMLRGAREDEIGSRSRTCQRCGTPLHGRQRQWCSEACRRAARRESDPVDAFYARVAMIRRRRPVTRPARP